MLLWCIVCIVPYIYHKPSNSRDVQPTFCQARCGLRQAALDPNVGQADAAAMKKVDAEGNHRKFTKKNRFFFIGIFTNNHDNSGGKLMVKWDIYIYIYILAGIPN